ncbi:cyclopropane-fatty-acyl-phospholipid synthase family protein [Micromonospora inaquosa]|uniref:cyclopropane-fatty-acyl-phospholipid synthase family protein n=1 Tax=Micromonospora inaquosa TaxID=2203716 RepID=UPI003410CBA5
MTAETAPPRPDAGVANRFLELAQAATGRTPAVRLRAWDGSEAGPHGVPVVVLRERGLLRRLLWHPNELGLARAYVAGEIDVDGDLGDALLRVRAEAAAVRRAPWRVRAGVGARAAALALRLGMLGRRPARPPTEAALTGSRHSPRRDRAAVAFHYDLSNEFYQLILDPSLAYSCAYWPEGTTADLAAAQRAKLDLICAKLRLRPGDRLLDVGCGWGSLACHAARHHGARVTAVTVSGQQHAFVAARIAAEGLDELVDLRLQDYRDPVGGGYDAVAAVEMGEHVGAAEYPAFAARLRDLVRPGGRVLVQQISRGAHRPGGGAFIEAYIAPDMHMRPLGATVSLLEDAGLEVRGVEAMREHYGRTIRHWLARLEAQWPAAVGLIGLERARIWRLYLAGGAQVFEDGRMGVDQILAVRPGVGAQ